MTDCTNFYDALYATKTLEQLKAEAARHEGIKRLGYNLDPASVLALNAAIKRLS